ncbi:MAG TPA: hypothetical protein DCQ06_07240 [Myxococcales bacterium]|nr:hypothetical protein [Myxococcales bacterium]HAN31375.1 hypothetical protein [Myxococcales bacterium]
MGALSSFATGLAALVDTNFTGNCAVPIVVTGWIYEFNSWSRTDASKAGYQPQAHEERAARPSQHVTKRQAHIINRNQPKIEGV